MLASFNPMALQDQHFSNFVQGKAKLLRLANELKSLDVLKAKESKPAFAAWWPLEKAFLFVEANGVHCEPRLLRDCADLQSLGQPCSPRTIGYSLEPTLESRETFTFFLPPES